MTSLRDAYDEHPYPFLCFNQSHPARLAAIATLLGLVPPPVTTARVLELGCAAGGNLIPMAEGLPQATFLGVDLAPRQIAMGQALIDELGLSNIALETRDIRELSSSIGEFDYIVAHGVYSWTPEDVRDQVLAICHAHLAPQGVAYVSYNTYPGWYRTQRLREMFLYYLRHEPDRSRWPDAVRDYLSFLLESAAALAPPPEQWHGIMQGTYHSLLTEYAASAGRQDSAQRDLLMLHDELGEINQPVYFHEFVAHAARHGLQYLAEADFPQVMVGNLPEEVARGLQRYAHDVVELEQQMDFVRNRTFRQTLLVRAAAPLGRELRPERLQSLAVSSRAALKQVNPETGVVTFEARDGARFRTDHPLTRTALFYLTQITPQVIPFVHLLDIAREHTYRERVPDAAEQARDAQALAANLLQAFCYSLGLVELHGTAPAFLLEAGDRPVAAPLARLQAGRGERATNRRHERVELDPVTARLLPLLDGTRDRRTLSAALRRWAERGDVILAEDDGPITAGMVDTELENALTWLARSALIVG